MGSVSESESARQISDLTLVTEPAINRTSLRSAGVEPLLGEVSFYFFREGLAIEFEIPPLLTMLD